MKLKTKRWPQGRDWPDEVVLDVGSNMPHDVYGVEDSAAGVRYIRHDKANPPQVDATLEMKTASEWLDEIKKDLVPRQVTSLEFIERIQADAIAAHARKSQPGVTVLGSPFECTNCGHKPTPQKVVELHGDCEKCGDTVLAYTVDAAEYIVRAAESAASGEAMEVELADALNALLDGLDSNGDESGGLSDEQWHQRITSARLVLHRFDRMEQRREAQATIDAARKTEGAK